MSFFESKSINAKYVAPNLVASFPTANPPLIWKFDLDRNHSFTIALQGEMGDWELGVTSPKGDFYPVAHFPAKEDAELAMTKVQKVLMQKRRSWIWAGMGWFFGLIGVLALIFAAWLFFVAKPRLEALRGYSSQQQMEVTPQATAPIPQQPIFRPGVPASADDVLKAPN